LELENRRDVVGQDGPFEGRNMPLDALIELRKRRGNPGGGVGGLQHGHLLNMLKLSISLPRKNRAEPARHSVMLHMRISRPKLSSRCHQSPNRRACISCGG